MFIKVFGLLSLTGVVKLENASCRVREDGERDKYTIDD